MSKHIQYTDTLQRSEIISLSLDKAKFQRSRDSLAKKTDTDLVEGKAKGGRPSYGCDASI